MNSQLSAVFKATLSVATVMVLLAPTPVLLAPTDGNRGARSTASNTSMEAFTGLTVSLIYTEMSPVFSSSVENRDGSSVANSMCDLLAYHDILGAPPLDGEDIDNSTTPDNTTDNLMALLKLNVNDTCAWLRQTAAEESTSEEARRGPTSCDLDYLRLFCVTRRLAAIELTVSEAIRSSIYETYNGGSTMPITLRPCEWIDRKATELKPQLDPIFFC